MGATTSGDSGPQLRVTTLELFFDLVFVFTITQLTGLLAHELSWTSMRHAVVLLLLIFWMYDGYAWLTNAAPAHSGRLRVLLLAGMAGYLVLALSVPSAFHGSGLAFGLAYLVIVCLHTFLYTRSPSEASATAIRGIAPYSLGGAVAILGSGAIGGDVQEVVWSIVAVGLWISPHLAGLSGFEIAPAHFVERHGLVVIVAIGESVVAIGIGAARLAVDPELVSVAILGLLLSTGLWWAYFGTGEDERAERAMVQASAHERAQMAFTGFGYAHWLILLGIILTAVGIKAATGHANDALTPAEAFALCGGVTVFLIGDVWFRTTLRLGRSHWRGATAIGVLAAVPVATQVSAAAGLAATTTIVLGGLALEHARTRDSAGQQAAS